MSSRIVKRGFTLIELLVVIAIIAILASILFPVFAKAREKARQTTCTSQVRQLATAIQMYVQDNNGKYPGMTITGTGATATGESWNTKIDTYVGNSKMLHCPSDANTDEGAISYAYNGLLIKLNGDGVAESQISAPTDVGVICDADPSSSEAGFLGGAAHLTTGSPYYKTPSPRHGGVIVGYCDGHAKYAPGKTINEKNMVDPITRAFYMATSLGLLDNPSGGINEAGPSTTITAPITIGGDYCARPILLAAAEIWKKAGGSYTIAPFRGSQSNRDGLPQDGRTVIASGNPASITGSAIATDAMVVIVARNTKVKNVSGVDFGKVTTSGNNDWCTNTATVAAMYSGGVGYSASVYQCYTYDAYSGSRTFFYGSMGITPPAMAVEKSQVVANDLEMVEKVAADPYGIGYCSAAFADLDRVIIVGLLGGAATTYTEDNLFPSGNKLTRNVYPATAGASGTLAQGALWRTLKVAYQGGGAAHNFYSVIFAGGGASTHDSLELSPVFKASYYP